MKLDKIRQMNDEELKSYLQSLTNKKKDICIRCGDAKAKLSIYIKNKPRFQQKKLCSLCEKCYEELLEYLETEDIDWE